MNAVPQEPSDHQPMQREEDTPERDRGQVSEVSGMTGAGDAPIAPEDATAGYPESESGDPQEGTAGPDAPPKRGRAIPDRQWDDD